MLILLIFALGIFGQVPQWKDLKLFGANSVVNVRSIDIDKNNSHYITGFYHRSSFGNDSLFLNCQSIAFPNQGSLNGFVFRFDSTRKLDLSLSVRDGLAGATAVYDEGNIFVSGGLNYGASRDGLLRKYDKKGNELWTKSIQSSDGGRNGGDIIDSLDISKDGWLIVSAFSYGNRISVFGHSIVGPSNFIAKLNVDVGLLWV